MCYYFKACTLGSCQCQAENRHHHVQDFRRRQGPSWRWNCNIDEKLDAELFSFGQMLNIHSNECQNRSAMYFLQWSQHPGMFWSVCKYLDWISPDNGFQDILVRLWLVRLVVFCKTFVNIHEIEMLKQINNKYFPLLLPVCQETLTSG